MKTWGQHLKLLKNTFLKIKTYVQLQVPNQRQGPAIIVKPRRHLLFLLRFSIGCGFKPTTLLFAEYSRHCADLPWVIIVLQGAQLFLPLPRRTVFWLAQSFTRTSFWYFRSLLNPGSVSLALDTGKVLILIPGMPTLPFTANSSAEFSTTAQVAKGQSLAMEAIACPEDVFL